MLSTKTKDAWFSTREKFTAERRKPVDPQPESPATEVASDMSKWIDSLFEEIDIEELVAEVLESL